MKHDIKNEIQQLNCNESDPGRFKAAFQYRKQRINDIIENISDNIEKYYINFQNLINQLIKDFQIGILEKEKNKINLKETIKIGQYFRNNIDFDPIGLWTHYIVNIFGFLVRYKHKYEDDIKNTCSLY